MMNLLKMKTKMKRKELQLDEFNDDFSDFSLSSPARKIRRLNAELPPIMEEEEAETPMVYEEEQPMQIGNSNSVVGAEQSGGEIKDLEKEERAIVVFNPLLIHSPSNFSITFDSHILKSNNQFPWPTQFGEIKSSEEEEAANNDCLAVVPWVPSQIPPTPTSTSTQTQTQTQASQLMEGEEIMDIEEADNNGSVSCNVDNVYGGSSQGFHQWQQQHCMIPQLPQNTSPPPITWFR